ncbi:hypothetical protein QAD02_002144 [Eretmocerus hayati]|uniref:Uncharacterized protein n=1 Tax=Eretmocerus hayati TaxID=131215 RepID=A0ACC2NI30_9HYME|nr:hypothetical protein QAD02_002144 [Eretmocerus hayati]
MKKSCADMKASQSGALTESGRVLRKRKKPIEDDSDHIPTEKQSKRANQRGVTSSIAKPVKDFEMPGQSIIQAAMQISQDSEEEEDPELPSQQHLSKNSNSEDIGGGSETSESSNRAAAVEQEPMVLENTASTAVTQEHEQMTAVEPPTINEQHAQSNGTRTNSNLSSDDGNSGNINDAHAEALPVAQNRRNEVYPLPVDGEKLGSIRRSWCAGKSLSQVVSHLLHNMFTVAELVAHSMFGGAEGGAARTPSDQNK